MLPSLTPMELKIGDDADFSVEYLEDDETPIDVDGWAAELKVSRVRKGGPQYTYTDTLDPGVIWIVPSDPDPIKVFITGEMTRLWTGNKETELQLSIRLTDLAGKRTTIFDAVVGMRGDVGSGST